MSSKELEKVIARVAVDSEFQAALAANPADALDEYDLSEEETANIMQGLSDQQFDVLEADLGERTSRAGIGLGALFEGLEDAVGELGDSEIEATPITLPEPPTPPDSIAEVEIIPVPIPDPADQAEGVEVLPITLPDPDDPVDELGTNPVPLPEPANEEIGVLPIPVPGQASPVEDVGASPLPIPRPEAEDPGALPIPTLEPASSPGDVGDLPISNPEPASSVEDVGGPEMDLDVGTSP